MLWFGPNVILIKVWAGLFKNILCYGSAFVPCTFLPSSSDLKTSYVMVRLIFFTQLAHIQQNLKTSYVMVRLWCSSRYDKFKSI